MTTKQTVTKYQQKHKEIIDPYEMNSDTHVVPHVTHGACAMSYRDQSLHFYRHDDVTREVA